jgi:hypothetical protein
MNTNRAFCISLLIAMGAAPAALAKTSTTTSAPADDTGAGHTYVQPLPDARTLADNVVVQPNPAPGTIVETPPTTTVPPPVVEPRTTRREVIHTDATPPRSYMGTIAVSAIMGGVTGVLIGGAIYYLGSQTHPYNIAYWAAGGVLVGTGVGLTQILIQESRASQATAFQDPAPTYRLALFNKRF